VILLIGMAQPNSALSPPRDEALEPPPASKLGDEAARGDVVQLLRRAAQLAAERGVESDLFMQAAWAACLDATPGLREQLEDKELRKELKKLRKRGLVAVA
jgi:hypothetical protein